MRQLLICIFALFACVYCANSQVRGNEIRVVVSPDHADWTYDLNEPCSFTIQVYTAQNLLKDVTIDYSLGPEMYPGRNQGKCPAERRKANRKRAYETPRLLSL